MLGAPAAPGQDREAPQAVKNPLEPGAALSRLQAGAGAGQGLLFGDVVGTWHLGRDQPLHLSDGKQLLIRNPQRS